MPTAEITVSFCNPQKPGKKNASVKTADNQLYLVPPELYPQFSEGNKYKVDYKNFKTNDGTVLKIIEKAEPMATAAPAPGRNKPGARYQDDAVVAERIFVCGAINNMMANQNIDPRGMSAADVTEQVNKLREVWRKTFGNPQQNAEMGDEVPF